MDPAFAHLRYGKPGFNEEGSIAPLDARVTLNALEGESSASMKRGA